ncbi:protein-L-isoaspartate(D-aspartate) O-methyltransferase [Starkeya sp. ORNL1]|uniref:protein-L-isoaspartate(D-aspartate) O-methyltransferase n=1 Tax=Starkeya sp. ORNL1 TaxID=2709380 RepID=UPI0014642BD1|nr:protein-L-isoaspartate(D-aspartate) O-methyltransferase [Starkeya sp. ORNL1]QJP12558.1 protein-L-isoaspartate(D-aspartate) O-methyltransferase [Starkeya sp. ORNL1]
MRVTFVPDPEADDALERAELLLTLRKRGIRDPLLMRAFEQVPRERFVDPACRSLAWVDQALPISCGQTISQPAVVALMTEALDLKPSHSVLEIGTGSGYHAAILGQIAERVVTLERFRTLAQAAAERLRRLGYTNIEVVVADGSAGYAPRAPYDRIIITAAVNEVPPALFDQLRQGGVLVAPVGPPQDTQMLTRFALTADGIVKREMVPVRFVPLLKGVAQVL